MAGAAGGAGWEGERVTIQRMTIGPERRGWAAEPTPGDCPDCGLQCAPECGVHPVGCFYGGGSTETGYWLIADGCGLFHGAAAAEEPKP